MFFFKWSFESALSYSEFHFLIKSWPIFIKTLRYILYVTAWKMKNFSLLEVVQVKWKTMKQLNQWTSLNQTWFDLLAKLDSIVFCCHLSRVLPVQEALRPPPEGLCLPWTPPRLRCLADAQPASLWTPSESLAHCCCARSGWHRCPSPQRPALHGGTFHLKQRNCIKGPLS